MGAIKPQPVFGMVKPAVLVTVRATNTLPHGALYKTEVSILIPSYWSLET
jgi:hypothetical protein